MATTFEEQIKEYDRRNDIHYFVYFSCNTFAWNVDVLQFKDISDIKTETYKNRTYYDTYAEAKAIADKLTEDDKDMNHIIARTIRKFTSELYKVEKDAGKNITFEQIQSLNAITDVAELVVRHLNQDFYKNV